MRTHFPLLFSKHRLFRRIGALCILLNLLAVPCRYCHAKPFRSQVLIIADSLTFTHCQEALQAYARSIEDQGKDADILQNPYATPHELRDKIQEVYRRGRLEGVVLVGDIPIAMIRDAQHLTTAFKMNPKRDWQDSSVPSDRIYDCFSLQFDYIKQDSLRTLYHYYSLKAESAQQIKCDIYSARIKPPKMPGKDGYRLINEYLQKTVALKGRPRAVNKILHFAGHGYNSESMQARMDEAWALRQHFPALGNNPACDLVFINFDHDNFVKPRLLAAIEDPATDIAILHHHGSPDVQYLSATPNSGMTSDYIENAKRFFRNKLRSAKDTTALKAQFIEQYDIPPTWLEHAFDPKITQDDSLFSASMDIDVTDLDKNRHEAKVILFDACYNGSFHLDDYICGHYLFNPGGTVVVKGNTVNTLQDTWTTELIGLLGGGVCFGNWAKLSLSLESHILGDPCYRFTNTLCTSDLDRAIVEQSQNPAYWQKLLKKGQPADLQALAMKMLFRQGAISSARLLEIQETSPSPVVRLQAFSLIKARADAYLSRSILTGLDDSYELTRRLSALTAAVNGDPSLLPVIVRKVMDPATSARVYFQLLNALSQYPAASTVRALKAIHDRQPLWPEKKVYDRLIQSCTNTGKNDSIAFADLCNPQASAKEKSFTLSAQRNACNGLYIDCIFDYIESQPDARLRRNAYEVLGWYRYAEKKDYIVARCHSLLQTEPDEKVRSEINKTIKRLQ